MDTPTQCPIPGDPYSAAWVEDGKAWQLHDGEISEIAEPNPYCPAYAVFSGDINEDREFLDQVGDFLVGYSGDAPILLPPDPNSVVAHHTVIP